MKTARIAGGRRTCAEQSFRSRHGRRPSLSRAFTLIEILVVVGIIAVVMTMSVAMIHRQLHPDSLPKAVKDILDACKNARGRAILEGVTTELVIRPFDHTIDVATAASGGSSPLGTSDDGGAPAPRTASIGQTISTMRISDQVAIDLLDVNFISYLDEEAARVRFYRDGTCDEFTILLRNGTEFRKITLEVVTAMADVESDRSKMLR